MEIKTKYSIGEKVYWVRKDDDEVYIKYVTIRSIEVSGTMNIYYGVKEEHGSISEENLISLSNQNKLIDVIKQTLKRKWRISNE